MWTLNRTFTIINLKTNKYMRASKFMKIAGLSPSIYKCVSCTADSRLLVVSREYVNPVLKVEFSGNSVCFKFYQKAYSSDLILRFSNAGYKTISW